MGLSKLSVTYKNKTDYYTINNDLDSHVQLYVIENILKEYPKDATIDIIDKISITELTRPTLDNIIKQSKYDKTNQRQN